MVHRKAIAFGLFLAAAQIGQAQRSDQQVVDQFFPQQVLDSYAEVRPGEAPVRQTAFIAADLNATGRADYLIALYAAQSLDTIAVVRVLRKDGNSTVVAAEPEITLQGRDPAVSAIDLDHSGRPQFLIELVGGADQGTSQTVLRWNGTAMEIVGPVRTEDGAQVPNMTNGRFIDLDGDGILEAVDPPGKYSDKALLGLEGYPYTVHKLFGGVYAKSGLTFDFFQDFTESDDFTFAAADPSQPHIMTIANGDGRNHSPVTSAEIRLNGVRIAGTEQINQQTRTLRIPVTVTAASNALSVTVTGNASSALYIGIGPEHAPTMSIEPVAASVRPGGHQQFTVRLANTDNTSVTWQVSEAPGSSVSKVGSIDKNGMYTAPDSIPQAGTAIVTAFRDANGTNTATATITLIPTVALRVTPAGATMAASETQQFAAIVTGAADTSVSWSIYPHLGFMSTAGLYTAPASVTSEQQVIITATSNVDRAKSAMAIVTLKPPPPRVAVSPSNPTVHPGQGQQFTAVVTNTDYTDVIWSINPQVGRISYSGLYTPPGFVASPQTLIVTATSRADSTVSATATINLVPNVSDAVAPPTGLSARAITQAGIDLFWTASGGQVAGYNVFRDGTLAGSTVAPFFSDLGLKRSTSYVYTVSAYDSQGTNSAPSAGVTAATPGGEIVPGLVLSYSFDEGAGDVAHDLSGNGNNGVITSAAWSGDGKLGGALVFDGKSSWVTTAGAPSLDLTVGMTLEAWVKPSSLGNWRAVLAKEGSPGISWGLFANNSWPSGRLFIGDDQMVNANGRFTQDQWAHLAVTYDGITSALAGKHPAPSPNDVLTMMPARSVMLTMTFGFAPAR